MTSPDDQPWLGRIAAGTSPIPVFVDRDDEPTAEVEAPPEPAARRARVSVAAFATIDAGMIEELGRTDLEAFINLCHHLTGDTPLCTFAAISDDELRVMALRVRARVLASDDTSSKPADGDEQPIDDADALDEMPTPPGSPTRPGA